MIPSFSTLITADRSATDQSAYVTASVTPAADTVVFLGVVTQITSGTPNTPTATGGGVATWEVVADILQGQRRLTVLRAAAGSSPTSGAITIDYAGQTQTACGWHVIQAADVETGSNGADAVAQTALTHNSTSGTAITWALASPWASSDNRALLFLYHSASGVTFTNVSGVSSIGTFSATAPGTCTSFSGRNADSQTLDASSSTGGLKLGIAFEVAGAIEVVPDPLTYPRVRVRPLNGRLN